MNVYKFSIKYHYYIIFSHKKDKKTYIMSMTHCIVHSKQLMLQTFVIDVIDFVIDIYYCYWFLDECWRTPQGPHPPHKGSGTTPYQWVQQYCCESWYPWAPFTAAKCVPTLAALSVHKDGNTFDYFGQPNNLTTWICTCNLICLPMFLCRLKISYNFVG